ncbi:hypothetical protein HJC99_04430 [Candidatus Saccharibacteria bacterium]|nr:hypothetical protein [Candidatus Saccharibacteria bacterium]
MNPRTLLVVVSAFMMAALPNSTHYSLGSYGFGTGGTAGTSSTNYAINGIAGDTAGTSSSANFTAGAGANYQQQADVPLTALSNPANAYNRMNVNLTPNGNPTDAKYVIAMSRDGFATTMYVKSDLSLTPNFSLADFQTYAFWGGASGFTVRGLTPNSLYTAKAAAYRGIYTQSPYGPTATGVTTNTPTLSFEIDISATDTSTSPPYNVTFGNLLANTVTTPAVKVWLSLDTNADSGGLVFVSDQNAGLMSTNAGYTLSSATGDIASATTGYGVVASTATQTSGGPLTFNSPFNGTGTNIGGLTTNFQQLLGTTAPVTAGRASFDLKAKSSINTPVSADYSDIMTIIAAASF